MRNSPVVIATVLLTWTSLILLPSYSSHAGQAVRVTGEKMFLVPEGASMQDANRGRGEPGGGSVDPIRPGGKLLL